jgi:protein-tyrosine sulfotransferase
MDKDARPIFVLCHGRSGSTLLRYILDTHKKLVCPPELHLASLMARHMEVMRVLANTCNNPVERRGWKEDTTWEEQGIRHTRQVIVDLMNKVCAESGKPFWCDKSVSTVNHVDTVVKIFPKARFLCIYRHCLDFVNSALQTIPAGLGYGYEEYVKGRDATNVVDSLVAFWCEKTQSILNFERNYRGLCLGLTYETLVHSPHLTIRRIFEFLELDCEEEFEKEIFVARHAAGPGDYKIADTRQIESASVGTGRHVALHRILPNTLTQMNFLLSALGYENVGADWNMTPTAFDSVGILNPATRFGHK